MDRRGAPHADRRTHVHSSFRRGYNVRVRIISVVSIFALVVLLSGCLGATTSISIEDDGSGEISINYRISKLVAYIGSENSPEPYLSIPLSREDVETVLDGILGATLGRFDSEDETEDIVISADIEFDNLETLVALFVRIDGPDLEFSESDGTTTMSLAIYDGLETPADETISAMVRAFFSDYNLKWEIEAPAPISSTSGGSFDARVAEIEYATHDVLLSNTAVVWELEW